MKESTIKELAYFIKEAKTNGQPQPIFFLGAGASVTGDIPLTGGIVEDILKKYPKNPRIKNLKKEEKTYVKLMRCLSPHQRNELLKDYIDKAKINVTHIYLAQLLKDGYADYILAVNFDNLMLRALALYNIFPPTYDLAILNDLTTTTFKENSVVYLHGHYHGLWLLNTKEEMSKVKPIIPRIFDSIKNKRPWIFIGYSGDDPIFDYVKSLGRFDNGLYWIGYEDERPIKKVEDFMSKPNTNAFLINDADSFMLKLNRELNLEQPPILDKPFSALKIMLDEIVDINDDDHFVGVKERLKIAKRYVDEAVNQFEEHKEASITKDEIVIDSFRKKIIELIVTENYNAKQIALIEAKANSYKDKSLDNLLSDFYYSWANKLLSSIKNKKAEDLYQQAFEKYQKATNLNPKNHKAFINWGNSLGNLAETKKCKEAEDLYQQVFKKFQKAAKLKPDYYKTFYNWGRALGNLAETNKGKEAEDLYQQAFDKYRKATDLKPNDFKTFNNWGVDLGSLAETKPGKEADNLFNEAIEKCKKAIDLGGGGYNLACIYSLRKNKKDALKYLEISLSKKEITVDFVLQDEDWKHYLEDEDFKKIINQFKK